MDVSLAVVDRLVANGIDTVFGIPGKQSLPLNEAIGNRDDIRFVVARHETAVTHQAWGYAETSGQIASTVVVPGPGDMNAMNGLKNALNDCTPLVHFAIETEPALRGGDAIHETPPDTYDNVVKENILLKNPETTAATIDRAVRTAQTAPKGPVRVGIPKNFLQQDVPLAGASTPATPSPSEVPEQEVAAAAEHLLAAEMPVIMAGGGVRASDGTAALRSLAERLGAPVVTTYKGKGVLPEDHDLSAGVLSGSASPELLDCLADSDVMLAVGSDLDAHGTRGWSVELPETLVHVTIDSDDLGTGYDPTVGILADAADAMTALENTIAAADTAPASKANGTERAQAVRDATARRIEPLVDSDPPLSSVQALQTLRSELPEEAITAVDAGGFRVWALNTFEAHGPRSYVNPGSWATMGTGLPSAIGAQLANPDTPVVALTGDGGLMMCVHELHTAVAEQLPITVVVLNNDDYAIISEEAGRSYDLEQQAYSWDGTPLDFVTIANGMGMDAVQANTPSEIRTAVRDSVQTDAPTLVEISTDPAEPQASEWMSE
ncbi:thiamine pyrophosphate-binding protein [Haloarcula sp. CBA1130]|uniref:thiamine pyrophosphate-binding protein n=1 Tax=unclassified Haloarcula TaxID=2624677 RepID=UPI001247FEAF|nr:MULTISPECIES: thiamine pyrophosphate-binding protein [unclassified Haloarcula]KAA9398628.1 thiamine pyrophosphate-binding protein [Haloarcula sp. CBA1129]KAA9403145.1 thiamine pyrophosphate-binding protein [Haloarcula sp. CBA1130]